MPTKKSAKTASGKKATATAKKKTQAKKKTVARTASGAKTRTASASASARVKRTASAAGRAKDEKKPARKGVQTWASRLKAAGDAPGPWTCPKCGPLPQKAQPLYGEDERHHCPNLDCDAVVTLLSKEDLEPAEKRGSWPPQRNKNRIAGGPPGPGGAPPPPPPGGGGD